MHIRDWLPTDLPALIDLTMAALRPLFEQVLPERLDPVVYAHDHGAWEDAYRREVPALLDPQANRFVTLAENTDTARALGYVG